MKSTVFGKESLPTMQAPLNAAYPIFLSLLPSAKLSLAVKLLLNFS